MHSTPCTRVRPPNLSSLLFLALGTIASRVMGFIRDILLASFLGVGFFADAFFVAFRFTNILRNLLSEGAFSLVLTPSFNQTAQEHGLQEALNLSRRVLLLGLMAGLGLALCGMLASKYVLLLFAPGLPVMADPATASYPAYIFALCLPYLPFAIGTGISMASMGMFGFLGYTPYISVLFNVVFSLFIAIGLFFFDIQSFSAAGKYACLALILAAAIQFVVQSVLLRRIVQRAQQQILNTTKARLTPHPENKISSKQKARRLLANLPLTLAGTSHHQFCILIAVALASFLAEGSISVLYFAERLIGFPLGIIGVTLGLGTLGAGMQWQHVTQGSSQQPSLSKDETLSMHLNQSLRHAFYWSIPATMGLAGLATPIITLLFERGAFTAQNVQYTALALYGYLPGLPAAIAAKPMLAASNSLGLSKSSVHATCLALCLSFLLGASALLLPEKYRLTGITCATSCASWAYYLFLHHAVQKKLNPQKKDALRIYLGKSLWAHVTAGVLMLGMLYRISLLPYTINLKVCLALGISPFIYLSTTLLLHSPEATQTWQAIKHYCRRQ